MGTRWTGLQLLKSDYFQAKDKGMAVATYFEEKQKKESKTDQAAAVMHNREYSNSSWASSLGVRKMCKTRALCHLCEDTRI